VQKAEQMSGVAEQVVEEGVHTDLECMAAEAAYWHSGTHRDSMVVVVDTGVVVVDIEDTRD